jgi:hypothetical protein
MEFRTAMILVAFTAITTGCSPMSMNLGNRQWLHRVPITIRNDNSNELRDFQVKIELDATNFDFDRAKSDLSDLRFADDEVTYLPHWVESFNDRAATIWVKTRSLAPNAERTIYLYYGNGTAENLSSGFRAFDFFDDFDKPGLGYFVLSEPKTILTQDQAWETQAPHTLSVVELNRDGYRYWGYYGLANCGGIGIARSNDLENWVKLPQPILNTDGERWPAVVEHIGAIYMIYDRDHCGTSHLVMRTSKDGANFDASYTVIVEQEKGIRNQNPALFFNPNDKRFYLYWFRGGEEVGFWQIKARHADTVEGLANPSSERTLLETPYTLAAPNMLFRDGVYFLSTEVNENAWKTKIYASDSPLGPFVALPGAIVLSNNEACWFQHIFENALRGYYCKDTRGDGSGWVLQTRNGDLSKRLVTRQVDTTFWTKLKGEWRIEDGVLIGEPGAAIQLNLPVGADKRIELKSGEAIIVGDRAQFVSQNAQTKFDDVRVRKFAPIEPIATVGKPEQRNSHRQTWFTVGNNVSFASQTPSVSNPLWCLGPIALFMIALFLAEKFS